MIRSSNIPFDNNSLFAANFAEYVINKQLKKIKKGIPKAIVQFGLFVLDIVMVIMFVLTAAYMCISANIRYIFCEAIFSKATETVNRNYFLSVC